MFRRVVPGLMLATLTLASPPEPPAHAATQSAAQDTEATSLLAPTPTSTPPPLPTTTATACFAPTPAVYPVISPTGQLIQTIRGSVHPVLCERQFDILGVEVLSRQVDCAHGVFEATIRLQPDTVNEFYVCQRGECATINCATVTIVHDSTLATTCAGDCDANAAVSVDEIVTLVNIALGDASPAACTNGIPRDATVDIALILQAVNNALTACPAP